MTLHVCSVFDRLKGCYDNLLINRSVPLIARDVAGALTRMQAEMKQKNITVSLSDFVLYEVGTFDDETGVLTPCTPVAVPLDYPKEEAPSV